MNNDRKMNLEALGIKIELTQDGLCNLSKILGEGCPVKISCDGYEPISCPYHWVNASKQSCERCWKQWLSIFKED